jgi:uracil-DNA glycosylase family 4
VVFITSQDKQIVDMSRLDELLSLQEEIRRCRKCPLYKTRKNAVPGEGPAEPKIMFVGEAPGASEDQSGRPFVGRSGELLTQLIDSLGLSRNEIFITSVLKSRPPDNRSPNQSEIDACLPYLKRQIEILNPRVVVLLGNVAVSAVIGPWKISEYHGRLYEGEGRTFFMTYHPAAALRFPRTREAMNEDFKILRKLLD